MTNPIASFSGIASGIQWRDLVDQIMGIEAQRRFNPVAARQSALRAQSEAWKTFQTLSGKVRDQARAVQSTDAFSLFRTAITKPASGRDLVSVSASKGAAPGSYAVEVLATAQTEKIAGNVFATATTAMGISGSFALNGRTVSVIADDTLNSLRDKINAANAGAGADGVSATIQASASGVRLVLTASATGAAGIQTTDDDAGTLQALGLLDGTTVANVGSDGAARTQQVSSATSAIAALLGVPLPSPSTLRIGGQLVTVDLSSDSLTTIATKIATATGNADAARVRSEKVGSTTRYWLETDATVEADAADAANSARTLAVLGFTKGGRGDVAQVIASANRFVDSVTGLDAVGTALLSNLQVNGQSLGLAAGDVVNIGGTQGDGSAVARTFTVGAGSTLQDLLNAIGDAGSGFGAGTRTASAGLSAGRITLADGGAGDSALGLSLTVNRLSGGTVSLGAFGTANGIVGRDRVITSGADAVVRVDGQLLRRATNVISDAITGVTLTALSSEVGSTTTVNISRDADGAAKLLTDFASSYNALQSWVTTNSAAGGALANSSALRSMAATLSNQLLQTVTGTTGTYTQPVLAGLERDKNGVLALNASVFKAAFETDFSSISRLFSEAGSATDSEVSFIAGGDTASATASGYAVNITQAATRASATGSVFTTYATTGTPDTMSITDGATGRSVDVSLANGDSIATIVQRLNTAFSLEGLSLSAERTNDDRITLTASEYGTTGGFTLAYTAGSGGDGTAALGLVAGPYVGLDVAGTINGAIATGSGQTLTGASGDASAGLSIRYRGSTARAAGSVNFSIGVGGMLYRAARLLAAEGSGASTQVNATSEQADALDSRLDDITKRLDARREALVRQFVAMEGAIAKSQALGSALAAQLNALSAQNSR
jgi:flagellar hook-associated protein 2